MKAPLIFLGLVALVAISFAQPTLPNQYDGRIIHPGSPLDIVMGLERNNISHMQTYPIDLTGLPGWIVFNAEAFQKDNIVSGHYTLVRKMVSQGFLDYETNSFWSSGKNWSDTYVPIPPSISG